MEMISSPKAPQAAKKSLVRLSNTFWIILSIGVLGVLALAMAGFYFLVSISYNPALMNGSPLYKVISKNLLLLPPQGSAILSQSSAPANAKQNFSNSLTQKELGEVNFNITDSAAPGQTKTDVEGLANLKITIAKIDVHLINFNGVQVDRWETLNLPLNSTYDLIALRNTGGSIALFSNTPLALGEYSQIRLYITSASGVTTTGNNISLTLPGGSGLVKVNKQFSLTSVGGNELTVDISADKSVIKRDNIYYLMPAVTRVLDNGVDL